MGAGRLDRTGWGWGDLGVTPGRQQRQAAGESLRLNNPYGWVCTGFCWFAQLCLSRGRQQGRIPPSPVAHEELVEGAGHFGTAPFPSRVLALAPQTSEGARKDTAERRGLGVLPVEVGLCRCSGRGRSWPPSTHAGGCDPPGALRRCRQPGDCRAERNPRQMGYFMALREPS